MEWHTLMTKQEAAAAVRAAKVRLELGEDVRTALQLHVCADYHVSR